MIKVSRLSLLKLPHGTHTETDIFGRRYTIIEKQNETTLPQAPRYWQSLLEEMIEASKNDASLRAMLIEAISRFKLGYETSSGSSAVHQTANQAESVLNNANANASFNIMPNSQAPKTTNSIGPDTSGLVPPKVPRNRNVSLMPDSLTNPSGSVNPNTQSPQIAGYHRSIRGSILLSKNTSKHNTSKTSFLLLKHYKCQTGMCKTDLHFIASDTSVDSDNDSFTREQLETWKNQIVGLPLTYDHGHSIKDEIGVITNSDIICVGNGYCRLEASAKLFDDHEIANEVKRNAEAGRVLEFSIGATNPKHPTNKNGVRHISDSNLLHVSVVQSGSNRNAKLLSVNN